MKEQKGFSVSTWIFVIAGLVVMFLFPHIIPAWGTVTEIGEVVLFSFVGTLLIVIGTGNLIWPIILGMFAVVVQGYTTGMAAVTGLFANVTVVMMIAMFVLSYALNESGFGYVVARFLLTRKFMKGRPVLFTFVLFITLYMMSVFINVFGALMFGFPLITMICKQAGYDENSQYYKACQVGVYMFATFGAMFFPFSNGMVMAAANAAISAAGATLDSAAYTVAGLVVTVLFAALYTLVMKFVFRIDMSGISKIDTSKLENLGDGKVTKKQIVVVVGFLVAVAYTFVVALIPQSSGMFAVLNNISQALWFCIVVAALCIIHVDGKPVIDIRKALREGCDWTTLFAIGGFMLLGGYVGDEACGIFAWLRSVLSPIFGGVTNFFLLMFVVMFLVMAVSSFFSNMMTVIIAGTIIAPFLASYGINPTVVIAAIAFASWNTFLTAAANGTAPILLALDGIDSKFIWTKGLATSVIYCVFGSIVFTALAYIL